MGGRAVSFFFSFFLQCKRIARRKGALISFLILPLLVLLLGLCLPRGDAGDGILVGVYVPEGSPGADGLWQALRGHLDTRGYPLLFIPAESIEGLFDQVAAGAFECGYLFPGDFRQRLREEDYRRLITRIESPATSLALLIDEAVSAAVLDICAPDIAVSYMKQSGILPGGQGAPGQDDQAYDSLYDVYLQSLIPEFFNTSIQMKAEIEYINGGSSSNGGGNSSSSNSSSGSSNGGGSSSSGGNGDDSSSSSSGGSGGSSNNGGGLTVPALLRGLTALYLFFFSCLCSLWFIGDCRSGFYRRLAPYVKPGALYPPYFCASALFAGGEGLLALLITGCFFPGAVASVQAEALSLLLYLVYLAAVSSFLAGLFRRQEPLAAALPFLLIACLLFCPILIDLGRFIPFIGRLAALLPPTFYLRAASALGAAGRLSRAPAALLPFAGYLPAAVALYAGARLLR